MTDNTSLVNLALQAFGSRTTVTAAELSANSTNEAIQANLTFENTRDSLLRMAPWGCAMKTANLTYITSQPGTPENTSAATTLWQPGQPRPPWAYEYRYPPDCLRACWIIPASQTGFTGIPITTAVTGSTPNTWLGGPIVFKIAIDNFICMQTFTVTAGGVLYDPGDRITLVTQPNAAGQPQGYGPTLAVLTVDGGGGILTASIDSSITGAVPAVGGGYFYMYATQPVATTTDGDGSGATITIGTQTRRDQRVILTNQEFATLVYVKQVTDSNVWDPIFQDAFVNALGADIVMGLTGDKALANGLVAKANNSILLARQADGNEGLTINDVTPDWIRVRGYGFDTNYLNPGNGFDWGGMLSGYA